MLKKMAEVYEVSVDYLIGKSPYKKAKSYLNEISLDDYIEEIIGHEAILILQSMGKMNNKEKDLLVIFLQGLKARRRQCSANESEND